MEGGKNVATGGDRHPDVSPVLQGGDTSCPDVRVRELGSVRRDDTGDGDHMNGVSKADTWEARKVGTAIVQQLLQTMKEPRGERLRQCLAKTWGDECAGTFLRKDARTIEWV